MSGNTRGLIHFWKEVKRRHVHRSLAIYAGTAFIILEACSLIFPRWGLPDWTIDLVLWLLILGAVVNVFVAWFYDMTPEGLQKTSPREGTADFEKQPTSRAWKMATYFSLVVIVGLILINLVGGPAQLRAGDIQSIAVLPFDNLTGDDQLDYYVEGMQASLITDMGKLKALRIISKTSASAYRDSGLTASEIARELNVDAVVEGSIMCLDDSICSQLRLVKTKADEEQIWAADYTEERSQVLNLSNRITKKIAQEVMLELTDGEIQLLNLDRTVNKEAYDAYLKGKYYWDQLTPEALQMALEYYNKAIEADPDWAPPYTGIAEFWIGVRQMGLAPSSITIPNIYKYLNKAIELDPNSAYTRYVSAAVSVWTGYDWEKGEKDFTRVIELNPNDAYNRAYYSHLLLFLKRHNEAYNQAEKALELDPLNPLIQGFVAISYLHIGRYEESKELANKVMMVIPNHPLALNALWAGNDLLGNFKEAIDYCGMLFALDEDTKMLVMDAFSKEGYMAALEKVLYLVEHVPDDEIPVSAHIRIAWLLMKTGRVDEALSILEEEVERQAADLHYVFTGNDLYKEIEDHPRFLAVQEKMGLPPMPE